MMVNKRKSVSLQQYSCLLIKKIRIKLQRHKAVKEHNTLIFNNIEVTNVVISR